MSDQKYYLVSEKYVGPNEKSSSGTWLGDTTVMYIQTVPGETNSSHEERTSGWLGTTNDYSRDAYGEYDSLEEAREVAAEMGYTQKRELESYEEDDDDVVESWVTEESAREHWDAGDWFDGLGRDGTCAEYGITVKTTDAEIKKMVEKAEDDAREDNVEIYGTEKHFTELRDELIEKNEEKMAA